MNKRRMVGFAALAASACLLPAGSAQAAKRPDLIVKAVSAEQSVPAGAMFTVHDRTANAGRGRAGRSITRFYLSADARLSAHDIRVAGRHKVAALGPGRASARSTNVLVAKHTPPGAYRLLGCADDGRSVRESHEQRNCRAAAARLQITPLAPSVDLIARAVARHAIGSQRGLVYRVFAAFGDHRLPGRFHGDDRVAVDGAALAEALQRWPRLSAATRRQLGPFFVPPFYSGSWSDRGKPTRTGRAAATPGDLCAAHPPNQAFGFVDGSTVRVWFDKADKTQQAEAHMLASEVGTNLDAKLAGVLRGLPSDAGAGLPCRGADNRVDVSLTPALTSAFAMTIPFNDANGGCAHGGPSFIVQRAGLSPDLAKATLAHELFHVTQFAYSTSACTETSAHPWLAESTATWFEDHAYPAGQTEQDYAGSFLGYLDAPFDSESPSLHVYGSYVFWLYLVRSQGSPAVIKATYDSLGAGTASRQAVDGAVPGGLAKTYPKFALQNWNRTPADDYQTWDDLQDQAHEEQVDAVLAGSELEHRYPVPVVIGELSAHYQHFDFTDQHVREIEVKLPGDPHLVVQAVKEIAGQWSVDPAPWSGKKTLCRDHADEDLQALVLIYSDVSLEEGHAIDLSKGGAGLTVRDACKRRVDGTITYTDVHDDSTSSIGTGAHHFTKTIKLDMHLVEDHKSHDWTDDGSTGSLSGSGNGFDEAGSGDSYCRFDATWTYSGSDPLGPVTFAVQPGSPEAGILGVAWDGKQPTDTTTTSSGRCEPGSSHDDNPVEASVSCSDGKVTRNAKGRLTVDFDTTETITNDTSQTGGTSTDTISCKGSLVEPEP